MASLALLSTHPALAQPAVDPAPASATTVSVRRPTAATNNEDATASGTVVVVPQRERALEDVGDAIVGVPGVRVRRSGAVGSATSVALRGAEEEHTAVLLGSIPLTTADSAAFDLSTLPLSALDSIEVYRGGAPAWYSEGAIGGVVRIVPRQADRDLLQAELGMGPYGYLDGRVTGALQTDSARSAVLAHVHGLSADNDYRYLDDNQTRFTGADDSVLRQRNGAVRSLSGLLQGGVDVLGGRLELLLAGLGRSRGVPGPLANPTRYAQQRFMQGLFGATYLRERFDAAGERRYRLQLVASATAQRNRFRNRRGELGMGASDTRDGWLRGFLRLAGSRLLLPFLEGSAVLTYSRDAYRPQDDLAFNPPLPSGRSTAAVVLEPRLFGALSGMRAELRPSLRVALAATTIHAAERIDAIDIDRSTREVVPTYRLAGVLEPTPGLALSSSIASGVRLPSIGELFGDRMFLQPNPELKPERSTSVDVSTVLRGRSGPVRGAVELRGFGLWIRDLIRYERTAQYTLEPANIASGRILGLELGASVHYGAHLALASSLTLMRTRNQFGLALPFRPPVQVLVRPEVKVTPRAGRLSAFGEAHYISFTYMDDREFTYLRGRTLLSLGAAFSTFSNALTLEVRLQNLLGTAATDVFSQPLPGRQLFIALAGRLGEEP